jgi:nicotinamidase/pyrazinamidase
MTRALVIVDVQNDFIDGSLAVGDGEQAAARIANLVQRKAPYEAARYDYVVTTQDWHVNPGNHFSETPDFKDTWPVHCVANTHGAELSQRLDPIWKQIDAQFHKGEYSGAYSGFEGHRYVPGVGMSGIGLKPWLDTRGVTEVDIVGIATDYCVKATALDAVKAGFTTRVMMLFCAEVDGSEGGSLTKAVEEMELAGVNVARHDVS